MNWKKLTLLSGATLAVVAIPQATGQDQTEARVSSPRAQMAAPASASLSGARPSRHFGGGSREFRNRGDGLRSGSSRHGNWRHGDRHRWGRHHHHRHWRHRHHYRPRYYSYYPYGFGYGYGYPFWGASADLYYNGYHPQYYAGRPVNDGGSVVSQVQQELANAGFYRGAIDGVIGNGTRNAIRAYERANGLRVDGRIDNQLLSTMGLS